MKPIRPSLFRVLSVVMLFAILVTSCTNGKTPVVPTAETTPTSLPTAAVELTSVPDVEQSAQAFLD
jgi:hypothetical protein